MLRKMIFVISLAILLFAWPAGMRAQQFRLENITILQDKAPLTNGEAAAADILSTEITKRTGLSIRISASMPASGDVILIRSASSRSTWPANFSPAVSVPSKPESYRILSSENAGRKMILVEGVDERGALFGAGRLLRLMKYQKGFLGLDAMPMLADSADKSIRGHQLGFRNTANSYDAWTREQFDQYIRDLVVFGVNSIESIPIFDEKPSVHFKVPPGEMNNYISSLCKKYALDYWMWVPAQIDLKDNAARMKYLSAFEKICKESAVIKGVFFPGGDPGDNPPELVMPLLQDMAVVLKKFHPEASLWLSLQGFTAAQNEYTYRYIREKMPLWLGGIVTGPSSPTARETRPELPARYKIRHYPDLTHNVRCEFEIPWWDPAFSLTLGREAVNPRPAHYTAIYREMEPYIDGFISYSDGIHDDVNKILWTELSWHKNAGEKEILKEYSNYFFGSAVADAASDGILALEKNWQGPIAENGGITTTRMAWQQLEKEHPELDSNWRWQMNLLRAYYDAYVRDRFLYETETEKKVNNLLIQAASRGAGLVMEDAKRILSAPDTGAQINYTRNRIIGLCESLYRSIGLQTSVKKYNASGLERGAVLDFIDRPLNNKWWLEDQFARVARLPEQEKADALKIIARWEDPGPGGYYDEVGNISKSPHEMKGEGWRMDPVLRKSGNPGYDFSDNGMSRKRLSWLTSMRWPLAMEYNDIDTAASYTVKICGLGESLLKVNGQRVAPSKYGRATEDVKEFPVPQKLVRQGRLILTWDDINEDFLNWRKQSRVSEVWLIKNEK